MQYQLCSDGHCLHILKQCVTLSVIADLRLLLKTNSTPSVTETGQERRAHSRRNAMLQNILLTGYKVLETEVTTLQKYSEIVHETVNDTITIKLLFLNFINTFS